MLTNIIIFLVCWSGLWVVTFGAPRKAVSTELCVHQILGLPGETDRQGLQVMYVCVWSDSAHCSLDFEPGFKRPVLGLHPYIACPTQLVKQVHYKTSAGVGGLVLKEQ